MKKEYSKIPTVLQKQMLITIALGITFLISFTAILCITRNFYLSCPCGILALFLIAKAGVLFYNCRVNKCIGVKGICTDFEQTKLRRRLKALYLSVGDRSVKVILRKRIRNLSTGDTVTVYMSEKTPVYEQDGMDTICSYYAIEKNRGETIENGKG